MLAARDAARRPPWDGPRRPIKRARDATSSSKDSPPVCVRTSLATLYGLARCEPSVSTGSRRDLFDGSSARSAPVARERRAGCEASSSSSGQCARRHAAPQDVDRPNGVGVFCETAGLALEIGLRLAIALLYMPTLG